VLPPPYRLRRSAEFSAVVRGGRRASRPLLTVHAVLPPGEPAEPARPPAEPARAGLVVSKAVGSSVVRSRTSRRLRHLLRARLDELPAGSRLVVRASAAAATATSADLGADLDAALSRLARRAGERR
jgi:ribonuclease P protein component